MADIREWENAANDNNKGAVPDFPVENQDKSSVNNCARENMAALRRAFENAPWVNLFQAGDTVSYQSADTIRVATNDYTAFFTAGRRIRVRSGSDPWVEREVASSVYGTDTNVTLASADPAPTTAVPNPIDTVEVFLGSSHQAAHHEVGTTTGKIPRIEDLGDGATLDQGDGGGFDADSVDGKHFSDITDEIAAVATAQNLLINSDFGIWQEFGPAKARGAFDVQFADGWAPVGSPTAAATDCERTTTSTEIPAGNDSGLRIEQSVADQECIGVYQIMEARSVKHLRGRTVSLSFQADALPGTANDVETIRWALLERIGTEDSPPASVVTTWSGAPLVPTAYTSDWTEIATGTGDLTVGGFVEVKGEMLSVGVNTTNLCLLIWASESDARTYGVGDGFNLGAVHVGAGDTAVPYTMEDPTDRLRRCQRFFYKSMELDDPAADNQGATNTIALHSDGLGDIFASERHPVVMHSAPTGSQWTVLSATAGRLRRVFDGNNAEAFNGTLSTTETSWRYYDSFVSDNNFWFEIHISFDAKFWG
jgi:hypothetical protein